MGEMIIHSDIFFFVCKNINDFVVGMEVKDSGRWQLLVVVNRRFCACPPYLESYDFI